MGFGVLGLKNSLKGGYIGETIIGLIKGDIMSLGRGYMTYSRGFRGLGFRGLGVWGFRVLGIQ